MPHGSGDGGGASARRPPSWPASLPASRSRSRDSGTPCRWPGDGHPLRGGGPAARPPGVARPLRGRPAASPAVGRGSGRSDRGRRGPRRAGDGARVALPLAPSVWRRLLAKSELPDDELALAILADRRSSRLYRGLAALDEPTLAALAAEPETLRRIHQLHADVLAAFGARFRVRGGAVDVPGGEEAAPLWQELVGVSPREPARFLEALVAASGGRRAFLYDAVSRLEPGRQRFALGMQLPAGPPGWTRRRRSPPCSIARGPGGAAREGPSRGPRRMPRASSARSAWARTARWPRRPRRCSGRRSSTTRSPRGRSGSRRSAARRLPARRGSPGASGRATRPRASSASSRSPSPSASSATPRRRPCRKPSWPCDPWATPAPCSSPSSAWGRATPPSAPRPRASRARPARGAAGRPPATGRCRGRWA